MESALQSGFVGRGPSTVTLVVHDDQHRAGSAEFEQRTRAVYEWVATQPTLGLRDAYGWSTLSAPARESFLGRDKDTAITSLALSVDDDAAEQKLPEVQRDLDAAFADKGIHASLLSGAAFRGESGLVSQELLGKAELFTLPLIVVMLFLLYRSAAAAAVSLAAGGSAVLATLALLTPIAATTQLSVFVLNVVTMLGLGVGIDYSLLMIRRFTEQLESGDSVTAAVASTLSEAGRAVLVSGATVMLATATLFVVPLDAIRSMAIGAVLVVGAAVCASIVTLPVLFHILGQRINAGRLPTRFRRTRTKATDDDAWYRHAKRVMRRPVAYLTVTAAAMLVLCVPSLRTELSAPDAQILPSTNTLRQAYDTVEAQFGSGAPSPITVVVHSDRPLSEHAAALEALIDQLRALPGASSVRSGVEALKQISPRAPFDALAPALREKLPANAKAAVGHYFSADGTTAVIDVLSEHAASHPDTFTLLDSVRTATNRLPHGLASAVGGETATSSEASRAVNDNLPRVITLMLIAVFMSLVVTFRSILLPLKAVTMNLLTVGASYGVLVAIFQWGWGASLGFDVAGYLVFFVPVLMLALLFGVNTDYEVFLLSRVREEYLASPDNTEAVARGVSHTAPLINWAAALMVLVFIAFGVTGLMPMQQLGLGLAVGVAADATIVRAMLVPATMRLMGRWNWWSPFSGHQSSRP